MLTYESRRTAGVLLVVFPSVLYGGFSLLMFLINPDSGYMQNLLAKSVSGGTRARRSAAAFITGRSAIRG